MENNNLFYVSMVAIVAIVAIFGIIQLGNYSGKTTYQAQNYAPPTSQSADSNSDSENLVGQAISRGCMMGAAEYANSICGYGAGNNDCWMERYSAGYSSCLSASRSGNPNSVRAFN